MSTFLFSAPLSISQGFVRSGYIEKVSTLHEETAAAYSPFLGSSLKADPDHFEVSRSNRAFGTVWAREQGASDWTRNSSQWCVTAGQGLASSLLAVSRVLSGRLTLEGSVWGSYAAILGELGADRFTAWQTFPALENIHYITANGMIHISNRPPLCAIAAGGGRLENLQLSDEYLDEYLAVGYSFSSLSPFEGVRALPVGRALEYVEGRIRETSVPVKDVSLVSEGASATESGEILAEAVEASAGRTLKDLPDGPIQLRLSGGKDSRVVAGALRGARDRVRAVTFGQAYDAEVYLSREIAQHVGFEHTVRSPGEARGRTLRERASNVMADCDGSPPSEPHLLVAAGAEEGFAGEGLILGQWPLYKGGLAKRMKYPAGGVLSAIFGQVNSRVDLETEKSAKLKLSEWFDSVYSSTELEKLYLYARSFRSGPYLHSHVIQHSKSSTLGYLLSDSQVSATCDQMSMINKVSERSLYVMMRHLLPFGTEIGLDKSRWRFEASGGAEGFTDFSLETRGEHAARMKDDLITSTGAGGRPYEARQETLVELATGLVESGRWERLSSKMSDEFRADVRALAKMRSGEEHRFDHMQDWAFIKTLWRYYAADIWLSMTWCDVIQD